MVAVVVGDTEGTEVHGNLVKRHEQAGAIRVHAGRIIHLSRIIMLPMVLIALIALISLRLLTLHGVLVHPRDR